MVNLVELRHVVGMVGAAALICDVSHRLLALKHLAHKGKAGKLPEPAELHFAQWVRVWRRRDLSLELRPVWALNSGLSIEIMWPDVRPSNLVPAAGKQQRLVDRHAIQCRRWDEKWDTCSVRDLGKRTVEKKT